MKRRRARRMVELKKLTAQSSNQAGFGYQIPPDFENVTIYFSQKREAKLAASFFEHFQNWDWKTPSGTLIRNWKVLATDWIYDHTQLVKLDQRKLENALFKLGT